MLVYDIWMLNNVSRVFRSNIGCSIEARIGKQSKKAIKIGQIKDSDYKVDYYLL